MRHYSFPVLTLLLVAGLMCHCAPGPYGKTNRQYKRQSKALAKLLRAIPQDLPSDSAPLSRHWIGTTNFNLRKPNLVIIHHTAQESCNHTFQTFTLPRTQVSAHYVICKNGTIHHMLNDYLRAWHGGIGRWGNLTDVNSSSIGIEIDNNGLEPFNDDQISSLLLLLDTLKKRYAIPAANFIGHADIAPTRKNDPNIYFPWKVLANRGFGLWYPDTAGVQVPAQFSNLQALRIIGYDVRDSTAAIIAFKRHFEQDTLALLTEADRRILYTLSQKY